MEIHIFYRNFRLDTTTAAEHARRSPPSPPTWLVVGVVHVLIRLSVTEYHIIIMHNYYIILYYIIYMYDGGGTIQ